MEEKTDLPFSSLVVMYLFRDGRVCCVVAGEVMTALGLNFLLWYQRLLIYRFCASSRYSFILPQDICMVNVFGAKCYGADFS